MTDNREEDPRKGLDMSEMDWTNTEYLAVIAAEELSRAMGRVKVECMTFGSEFGVNIKFPSLACAESLLALAVPEDPRPESFHDRAMSHCAALAALHDRDDITGPESDAEADRLMEAGWTWMIHPVMRGRAVGWHASVVMTAEDANQLTVSLNTLANGGAL